MRCLASLSSGAPPCPTHRAQTRRNRPAQARETADAERYLRALFEHERPGALIELRSRYRDGMRTAFLPAGDTFTAARTIVRQGLRTDVYIGVAPRRRRSGGKDALDQLRTLGRTSTPQTPAHASARSPSHPRS